MSSDSWLAHSVTTKLASPIALRPRRTCFSPLQAGKELFVEWPPKRPRSCSGPTGSGARRGLSHRRAGDRAGPRRGCRGRGRAPAGADRPRHARVGADARVGAGRRDRRGGGEALLGGRPADAGRGDRSCAASGSTWRRSSPPRTTPSRQRDQVLRRARHASSTTSSRRGSRPCVAGARRRRRRPGRMRELRGGARTTCASSRPPSSSTSPAAGSCSTARTARPTASRPQIFERLGAEVEAIGDRTRRAQHQRRLRLHPPRARWPRSSRRAPRSASPSTATATGCSPSTPRAACTTATSSSRSPPAGMKARGELGGGVVVTVMTNYGFHQAMEEAGIEVAIDPGRRPLRDRRDAAPRLDARRRAVGPHHRHRLRRHRRRDRRRADDDARARRLAASPTAPDAPSCRRRWTTSRSPTARRSPARPPSGRRSSARTQASRAAAACCCAPRHRAAGPGDGRGAEAEQAERGLERLAALVRAELS